MGLEHWKKHMEFGCIQIKQLCSTNLRSLMELGVSNFVAFSCVIPDSVFGFFETNPSNSLLPKDSNSPDVQQFAREKGGFNWVEKY